MLMWLLRGAGVFTLPTLVVPILWRIGRALFRRPVGPRFWRRVLLANAALFVFHAFLTFPLLIGYQVSKGVGTNSYERTYAGPRIASDGAWALQSRETLDAEREGRTEVDPEIARASAALARLFTASDGVKLRGFLVPPADRTKPPRFMAVLAHGNWRSALETETVGSMLRDLGGEVLLLEYRNHGGSDHAQATFGFDESKDVLAAAQFMRERLGAETRPLILFGVSLGTAAVSLAAPQVPDLGGLILDAPMDTFRATALRLLLNEAGNHEPWASTMVWSLKWLGGVPVDRVRPDEALPKLGPDVPVLMIGGGEDLRMTPDSVTALFKSLPTRPERKTLWIEPKAGHGKVWIVAPDEYRRHLAAFCDLVAPRTDAEAQAEVENAGVPTT